MSKPTSFEEADLITTVVNFVSKMIPSFNGGEGECYESKIAVTFSAVIQIFS